MIIRQGDNPETRKLRKSLNEFPSSLAAQRQDCLNGSRFLVLAVFNNLGIDICLDSSIGRFFFGSCHVALLLDHQDAVVLGPPGRGANVLDGYGYSGLVPFAGEL